MCTTCKSSPQFSHDLFALIHLFNQEDPKEDQPTHQPFQNSSTPGSKVVMQEWVRYEEPCGFLKLSFFSKQKKTVLQLKLPMSTV